MICRVLPSVRFSIAVVCALTMVAVVPLGGALADAARNEDAEVAAQSQVFDGVLRDDGSRPEISTAELRAALASSTVVVLDARPFDEFAVSHIPATRTVPGKPDDAFHNVAFFDGSIADLTELQLGTSP